jgi:hypothetical protein
VEAVSNVDEPTVAAAPNRMYERCFGRVGNCTSAPEYIWTGSHGGEYWLCASCCAQWRQETQGIAVVEPVRIRDIR